MTAAGAGNGARPRIADSDDMPDSHPNDFLGLDGAAADGGIAYDSICSPYGFGQPGPFCPNGASSASGAASPPESFSESPRDPVSDSDHSKRTGSWSSSDNAMPITASDIMMTASSNNSPARREWNGNGNGNGNMRSAYADEAPMMAGNPFSSSVNGDGNVEMTDELDGSNYFDFESASAGSPQANGIFSGVPSGTINCISNGVSNGASDGPSNGLVDMESPAMPTIHTGGANLNNMAASTPQHQQHQQHQQHAQNHHQQYQRRQQDSSNAPLTQPINGFHMSNSREVSPLSQAMAGHHASPSTVLQNTPPAPNPANLSNPAVFNSMNAGGFWPGGMDQYSNGMPSLPIAPNSFQQQQWLNTAFFGRTGIRPMQCTLRLHPTPAKSRVETQIPIKFVLHGLPPTINHLHLPTHTISKPKLMSKPPVGRSPDTLELYTQLVCTSAMLDPDNRRRALERAAAASHPPILDQEVSNDDLADEDKAQNGGEVRICDNCIKRERKRASRKKIKNIDDEELWKRDESRRVIVFNAHEVLSWKKTSSDVDAATGQSDENFPPGTVQVDAPMRIACYCRHHSEKMGFQVIFTIKDFQDNVVAQEMSQNIMITDDHKTHPLPPSQHYSASMLQDGDGSLMSMPDTTMGSGESPQTGQNQTQDLQAAIPTPTTTGPSSSNPLQPPSVAPSTSSLSRPASPSLRKGPANKKRKASGSRVPMEMAMTRLDTSPPAINQALPGHSSASGAGSPFTPSLNGYQSPGSAFGQMPAPNISQAFNGGPTTPGGHDQQALFVQGIRSASFDNTAMPQFSAPPSTHPSRAPSPNSMRQKFGGLGQNALAQGLVHGMSALSANNSPSPSSPTIHRIIPGEGPNVGGIEVTVLGIGFSQGLEVYFGDHKATTTTYWGETTLVCLVPPSPRPGTVPVIVKQSHAQPQPYAPNSNDRFFRYTGEDDSKLAKMMVDLISEKVLGDYCDIRELARRLMEPNKDWDNAGNGGGNGGGSNSGMGGGNGFHESIEPQLLKCLELVDLDDSPRMPRFDMRTRTGHTMLHFGCLLGYQKFVAGLLARGANPDLRDKGGLTPMYMAALTGNKAIVRLLLMTGADPTIRSLSGLRPVDITTSREIIEDIHCCEHSVRARRGRSHHRKASSATSLRSLWDPRAMSEERGVPMDGSESPEYTSGDFEESDNESEEGPWLGMRRRSSAHHVDLPVENRRASQANNGLGMDLEAEPGSPGQALSTAVREQVAAQLQQFQQAMQMHFPNLAHIPNLPQMPTFPRMPVLPNYQAYLQQSPFIDRMTSLMPNRPWPRPEAIGENEPSAKAVDSRWWDLSSLINNSAAPPPPYFEIYPGETAGEAFDKKQASAAQAAAEAEADTKCSKMYDTQQATEEEEGEGLGDETVEEVDVEADEADASVVGNVPKALKIGRKKAITKEQQQDFLRAHAEKFKGIRSDKNLWFRWVSNEAQIPISSMLGLAYTNSTTDPSAYDHSGGHVVQPVS